MFYYFGFEKEERNMEGFILEDELKKVDSAYIEYTERCHLEKENPYQFILRYPVRRLIYLLTFYPLVIWSLFDIFDDFLSFEFEYNEDSIVLYYHDLMARTIDIYITTHPNVKYWFEVFFDKYMYIKAELITKIFIAIIINLYRAYLLLRGDITFNLYRIERASLPMKKKKHVSLDAYTYSLTQQQYANILRQVRVVKKKDGLKKASFAQENFNFILWKELKRRYEFTPEGYRIVLKLPYLSSMYIDSVIKQEVTEERVRLGLEAPVIKEPTGYFSKLLRNDIEPKIKKIRDFLETV